MNEQPRASASASASAMDDFSDPFSFPQQDILLEILLRLDAKSLTSFKLASKNWYNFLSNPSFSKLYFKSRPSITGFFYRTSQSYAEKIQYVPLHPNQEPIIEPPSCLGFLDDPALLFNSCNGLLHWCTSWNKHFISNPLNHKFVPVDWPFPKAEVFASGIAFDPSVSSDQFEVIVLLMDSPSLLRSNTFSSDKMEWELGKEFSINVSTNKPYCPNRGVFINGVLYWELKNNSLLAYNVKDGIDWVIQLPTTSNFTRNSHFSMSGCLGESEGKKVQYCRVSGTKLFVWEQRSANSATTWAPLHRIELRGMIMCGGPRIKQIWSQALAFLDDCKGVLISTNRKIKAYYLEDGSVKKICQVRAYGQLIPYLHSSMFFPFVHTLALSNFQSV